ncbi:hypothetical protein L596_012628 [Steinernema carpocapsae]|uniref:Uncharacterized protein n=1 Tax=Steinernema carpocapsae TaxID=34508 RepID=A0A4U5NYI5_STECR|nr:hypothetical protein L596_012628 [Steinernema carpocapsae]
MGASALFGKTALRPSVASPPHSCLKALRCFAQLRSAATPPLPTFGGFAASQLRKRGSALRAFGSRSYYHKTKVALRPSSVASPPRFCQHLTALRCFAQLRSAAPPPLPTFGGFAAPQERLGPPGLRISFLLSQNKSRFAPLLGGFATSLLPKSFTLLCTATIGGFAASPLRSSAREARPSGPSDLVPTITKQKSLCAPRWLRHLTLASKLYVASHSYDRRLRRLFPPSAASPLRSSAREARPSGPSDLVPTITKQKSLCAPPRWLRHLAFANTSQLCAALHSYDRRLRRLFPPSAASPLRSSAREARPSGPSDLVITKQKSLCAPRWLRHLTLASKLYVALHSYDRRLRRLFPPSAASPLCSSARETRPSGPSDLVPTITKQKSLCAPRWLRHLTLASKLYVASHSYDRRLRRLFPPSAASPLCSSARETRPSGPSDLVTTVY